MFHFNSIKVQLELATLPLLIAATAFQFHKGTIRTHLPTFASMARSYFNSIKVQLEQKSAQRDPGRKPEFQFHKGTIRTR